MHIEAGTHSPCKLVDTKTGLTLAEGTYTYCHRIKLLLGTFEWHATTQGHNYWSEVYDNLRDIEEDNK